MGKVNLSIYRDNPNSKSTSFAIKLEISNQSEETIYLHEIKPSEDAGFKIEMRDNSNQKLKAEKRQRLTMHLTMLLAMIQGYGAKTKSRFLDKFNPLKPEEEQEASYLDAEESYLKLFDEELRNSVREGYKMIEIEDEGDAKQVIDRWINTPINPELPTVEQSEKEVKPAAKAQPNKQEKNVVKEKPIEVSDLISKEEQLIPNDENPLNQSSIRSHRILTRERLIELFEIKYAQLIKLEESKGNNYDATISVQPNSIFTRSYVVTGKRHLFNPTVHNVSIEVLYDSHKPDTERRVATSKTFYITPNSFALSALAAIFSFLGVVLQHLIENDSQFDSFLSYYNSLILYMTNGEAIKAAIIAIIFFNLYEQSPFSKKISFGSNWRTAFLVGIMSGMFGDRLVEALKIMIGL